MSELPRQCITTYFTPVVATRSAIFGSAKPPLTSLIIVAPTFRAALATFALVVSILTVVFGKDLAIASITGIVRTNSSASVTRSAPGRVDSPPTSMMSTPSEIISFTRFIAAGRELCIPPSAKESGVTFKIPITKVFNLTT